MNQVKNYKILFIASKAKIEINFENKYKYNTNNNYINMEFLPDSEKEDIFESIQDILEEYVETNASLFSKPNYLEYFVHHVMDFISILAQEEEWYDEDEDYLIDWITNSCIESFKIFSIPLRENSPYNPIELNIEEIDSCIAIIKEHPNYKQRSKEWHTQRNNLFSASNLWKLFSTPSLYNSLIYEKCKGVDPKRFENVDILSKNPRNWGVKYEPITAMLYEYKNHVKVNTDFGCLPHDSLPIGASPDGIVCDRNHEKYGNMVEIKNIYNREINGIPSEEYWVQIQTQLEVAKLSKCDFVETRIKEYETKEEFLQDNDCEFKGIVLFYLSRNTNTHESCYTYMPISFTKTEALQQQWIQNDENEMKETHILYETSYWYLDQYSCVEVLRNDHWFQNAIPLIKHGWETVEKERKEGYEHRAPQKRHTNINVNQNTHKNDDTIKIVKLEN